MVSLLLAIIYLSFVSLGLPDAILGAAWPVMHQQLQLPLSAVSIVYMVVSVGTISSSLLSQHLTARLGAGKVTAISVGLTALALFGFSHANAFWMLIVLAIPYGLGAGSVDAALNNYVAVHFASRHMSWLHCMWGIGASLGPYIMSLALSGGAGWPGGYRTVALLQLVLTAILLCSLPLWKRREGAAAPAEKRAPLGLRQIFAIPGAREMFAAFFCYCALEQTAILWASTYLVDWMGMDEETAAGLGSLFLLGMTAGRAASGFLTYKLSDAALIRIGQAVIALGILAIVLPLGSYGAMAGLLTVGLGCAPIYPCIIHSTPACFGRENSQAIIGVQMASAYVGSLLLPPLFGLIANHISVGLLPWYLALSLAVMLVMHERLLRKTG